MNRLSDYNRSQQAIDRRAEDYSPPHPASIPGRMYLVAVTNVEEIKHRIEFQSTPGDNIQDRHKFQLALLHQGINTLYSVFTNLRHHHYNSLYRELRYLMEVFLTLKGLNKDLEAAEREWRRFRLQREVIVESGYDKAWFDYEYVDYLGSRRDSERDILYQHSDSYRQVMNYLSERGAHPFRIDGSRLDLTYTPSEEWQHLWISLSLLLAITGEFELTLHDAGVYAAFETDFDLIRRQIRSGLPKSVPSFLTEYLH